MTRVDWQKALVWFVAIAASLLILATVPIALAAPHPPEPASAGGGRAKPCNAVPCLRDALAWQKHEVRHLRRRLAVRWQPTLDYACRLGEVAYGVPVSHCKLVVHCESGGNRWLVNSPGSDTARGYAQFLPSTWRTNPFGAAGFSIFDPVAPILGMDWYASRHGFNTSGGWAASHSCHGLG